jgi:hypothetical protein
MLFEHLIRPSSAPTICTCAVEEPKMLTLAEAGRRSGVDPEYLGLLAGKGTLSASKHGSGWYVSESELTVYLETVRRRVRITKNP